MYTKEQIAKTIDHAVLKPFATDADIVSNCKMVDERGVMSLCVRPTDVKLAAEKLADSETVVSMVVGFPHGSNKTETKVLETKLGAADGAVEFDMVMNVGKFLSGDLDYVKNDIAAVVEEAKKTGALVKVIQETCYLSNEQVAQACNICFEAGADFVKTSTGFGDGPATPEVIDIMMKTVGDKMGVKASGGVRTYETAVAYLKQGCKRLGVGSTEAVLDGVPAEGDY